MKKAILNALGEPLNEVIRDDQGQPILLNEIEQKMANSLQRQWDQLILNNLGYEVNITTLTTILKKVSEQKFFRIPFADYMPVRVGEGAFSSNLIAYRGFEIGDDFSTGIINTATNSGRLANADAGVDSVPINVYDWAKQITWTVIDIYKAAKAGNWDLITSKERARKTNWDLGIQAISFLGISGNSNVQGLLNLSGVTNDVTTLTSAISNLSSTDLSTFCKNVLTVYRANCNRTAMPTHFVIPEPDFLGLATPTSDTYPILSRMDLLQNTFRSMTGNPGFKVLPCAYGDPAYNSLGVHRYALYNSDEETLRLNIPVDYTNTLANSLNNFSFQNAAYGEFTGVFLLRPLEVYYFSY